MKFLNLNKAADVATKEDIECQCNGNCEANDECPCQQIPCADLEEICEHSRGCLDECGCS
mgnify:CR=1 FL=1